MLLRATLELPVPASTAADRLIHAVHQRGLNELSTQAYQDGIQTLTRVGPFGAVPGLAKTVQVETLEPRVIPGGIRVPLRWVATGRTGQLFPALDADLELTEIDPQRCLLAVNAAYRPPLGSAGAGLDRLLLHRTARATMRSLLHGLARSLLPVGAGDDLDQAVRFPEAWATS